MHPRFLNSMASYAVSIATCGGPKPWPCRRRRVVLVRVEEEVHQVDGLLRPGPQRSGASIVTSGISLSHSWPFASSLHAVVSVSNEGGKTIGGGCGDGRRHRAAAAVAAHDNEIAGRTIHTPREDVEILLSREHGGGCSVVCGSPYVDEGIAVLHHLALIPPWPEGQREPALEPRCERDLQCEALYSDA